MVSLSNTHTHIQVLRVRDVKLPVRANPTDAGIDFYMPTLTPEFISLIKEKNPHIKGEKWLTIVQQNNDGKYYLSIPANTRLLIPSGIKTWYNIKKSALIAFNKSGLASKNGIIVTAQVSDHGYTGELHLGILNTSEGKVNFHSGDKVSQFVHVPILLSEINEVTEEQYNTISAGTSRGDKGFGSSNNQ